MALLVALLLVALAVQVSGPHVHCSGSTMLQAATINRTWHTRAIVAIVAGLIGVALTLRAAPIAHRWARLGILLLTAGFIAAVVLFGVIASVTDQPCYT
jgi:hypothetical protein